MAKSGCSASVSWEQPINNRAIITGYRLEMAQVSDSVEEIVIVNLRARRRWNHLLTTMRLETRRKIMFLKHILMK